MQLNRTKDEMTIMNRREMMAGAVALLGSTHMAHATTLLSEEAEGSASASMTLPEKPKHLLSSIFTSELLATSLLAAADWHPYPRAEERAAWQQLPQEMAEAILARAEKAAGAPWESFPATVFLEFKRDGNRSHFERYYFARRTRLTDLALGECVECKGRFLDELVNGIWLVCEETFWGLPAHLGLQQRHRSSGLPDAEEPIVDLFAAETGATMAWIHYLLGPELDRANPMITRRIAFEVKRRILDPAFERDDFAWMFREYEGQKHHLGNWTTWIDWNWMAANLLLEPDAGRRQAALLKICRSLDQYMEDYSEDGCCEEGANYWNVSPGCYFECCMLLQSAVRGARDPLTDPFVRKMLAYIMDVHISGSWFVNYGDAPSTIQVFGQCLYRIGSAIENPTLQAYGALNVAASAVRDGVLTEGQGRIARAVPDLLVSAKTLAADKRDALVRDSWYPALGMMTARIQEGSAKGFYLAMQAAPNQRSHGHNDSGSIIVFCDGNLVIVDLGPETYSGPRYRFSVESAYHNLPTIGGVMQSNKNARYRATELRYSTSDARARIAMNLATAYPEEAGIHAWTRTLTLDRAADRLHLTDEFQLRQKVPVQLSFMTPCIPTQGPAGKIFFPQPNAQARVAALQYDPALLAPIIERIDLTDDWLVARWGKAIHRVLLTSVAPTDRGMWNIAFV